MWIAVLYSDFTWSAWTSCCKVAQLRVSDGMPPRFKESLQRQVKPLDTAPAQVPSVRQTPKQGVVVRAVLESCEHCLYDLLPMAYEPAFGAVLVSACGRLACGALSPWLRIM